MYGYNEYIPLNTQEILSRVTEEEIFNLVVPGEIILDKGAYYTAPYRNDSNPSCWFEIYEGTLQFIDFARPEGIYSLDCFNIVRLTYNVSYKEALQLINNKLKLGLGGSLEKVKEVKFKPKRKVNKPRERKEQTVHILSRDFDYRDKNYWEKYLISSKDLLEDRVIPIELYQSYSRTGKKFSVRPIDICYAYTGFEDIEGNPLEGQIKIYRPNASSRGKWFTNCNQDTVGSIQHLPKKGDLLIITKSYKDARVLRNFGLNAVWFQNEGMIPNKSILLHLIERFEQIVVWFDNDSTGLASSRILVENLNIIAEQTVARGIIIPPVYLSKGVKDPSDYLLFKGKEAFQNFLKQQKLTEL